jgi:pimeloyl-ACP methyl ester carboxylesterase
VLAAVRNDHFIVWACRFLAIVGLCLTTACHAPVKHSRAAEAASQDNLALAQQFAHEAANEPRPEWSARAWLHCAAVAYLAADTGDKARGSEAISLSTTCTDKFLGFVLNDESLRWTSTTIDIADLPLKVELRGMSPSLDGPVQLTRADAVALPPSMEQRAATAGLGVALVASTPRCSNRPLCKLYPPEGIFRPATAWIEADQSGHLHLVLSDPVTHPTVVIGSRAYPLRTDVTAPYAMLFDSSRLKHLAWWNLIGGKQIGLRQGLYLLEDYDPHKTPIVMVHGLGASPMVWARLTNRIFSSPDLHARYQVWHVVYQTNAPVLVNRLRVQEFLDNAWALIDPDGKDPSRQGVVLIGHSMGGVVARLLTTNSDDVLWNAVSTVSFDQTNGSASDIVLLRKLFFFTPYPGVAKAIFLAAPHFGSPLSDDFIGHLAIYIVTPHGPEMDTMRRIVDANASTIRPALLSLYRKEGLSSISTLSTNQPVSHAAQSLMPVKGIRYFTIAGKLPGPYETGDGVVPLASAILPGAESTTIVTSGHKVYDNDEAIAQIIKILGEKP